MLQPLVPGNMAGPTPHRLPESLLFRARSTEYLPRRHRKRRAPNRGKWLLALANTQNCDALTAQSNPMPSGSLQQDYVHLPRVPLPKLAPWLMRSYHLAPLLVRSLRPGSLGKRRSLRNATRTWPQSTGRRRLAYGSLLHKTGRPPSARSEHRASRILARTRNRPNRRACLPKRDRLQSLAQRHSVLAPARKLARQSVTPHSACPCGGNSATDPSVRHTRALDD